MDRDPLVLAYMAGVIDSDGYITIHRSTRRGVSYYAARIGVAGTRREPHDLAASLWGGSVGYYQPKNERHRGQFQWSRTGDAAYGAISDVLSFLRVKRPQAMAALELQEHVWHGRGDDPFPWMTPDYDPASYRVELRDEVVQMLNRGRRLDGRRTWDEYPAVTHAS